MHSQGFGGRLHAMRGAVEVSVDRELSPMPTATGMGFSSDPQDKLDDFTAAQMKFNVRGHATTIQVGDFPHES